MVIHCFREGHDVFTAIPSGYGKSYCFAMLPHITTIYGGIKSQIYQSLFHLAGMMYGCILAQNMLEKIKAGSARADIMTESICMSWFKTDRD